MISLARLVREPIDVTSLAERSRADGAVCLFVGVVRDENRGRTVLHLEYEAYEEMALPLGRLEVGEASVVIAVSSPHRAEAFAACRFAIDTLKAQVPIWKKELYADGSAWLDGTPVPPP
jgi:molybdopterin synthase catalytic subunit